MSGLTEAVVLITGAASGIGKATAEAFAAAGAHVVLTDIDEPAATAVADGLGDRATGFACDVTQADQVSAVVARAVEAHGKLDVLVNNAGVCVVAPVHELDEADFDRMIAVNLKGTFHGIQAAAPALMAAGGGAIVSVASTAGLNGAPLIGGYGATKAAIVSLTKTAAVELRPAGIRVNCVCPAMVDTPFAHALVPAFEAATGASAGEYFTQKQGRLGRPEDVARVIVHLASPEHDWVTGTAYPVDGGLMAASI